MAIPKGSPSEEGIAGKKARPVEVVTASGEHEDPKDRHTRYPGSRHHCHTTLPHVILCQHRQKTITLFHRYAKHVIDWCICVYVYIPVYAYLYVSMQEFVCAHSAFHDIVYLVDCLFKRLLRAVFIENFRANIANPQSGTYVSIKSLKCYM